MLYNLFNFVYLCTVIMVHVDCLENPFKDVLNTIPVCNSQRKKGYVIKHTLIHLINIYILSIKNEPLLSSVNKKHLLCNPVSW